MSLCAGSGKCRADEHLQGRIYLPDRAILQRHISTYTKLILGLPGETLDSFCRGLCELLEMGQHSSASVYHCELLPNARMNTPEYKKEYGVSGVHVRRGRILRRSGSFSGTLCALSAKRKRAAAVPVAGGIKTGGKRPDDSVRLRF